MASECIVTRDSIADTWEDSIRLLLSRTDLPIVDTDTGGATLELENLLLRVLNPISEPSISDRYLDLQLIDGYKSLFGKSTKRRPQEVLTIADRIYAWPTSSGKGIDQLRRVLDELRSNPTSRRAIVQIWNPDSDLGSKTKGTPSGHCYFYFSLRNNALNLTANSRSIDAWIGGLPNMLALVSLQKNVANRLEVAVGTYTHFVMSYHIYVRDLPSVLSAFEGDET